MDDELEKKWNEFAMAYFNILSLHSPAGTEKNNEKCRSG
jgi:hypothetical protein